MLWKFRGYAISGFLKTINATPLLNPMTTRQVYLSEIASTTFRINTFSVDEVWVKQFDKNKKANYWTNYSTNVITYDEPQLPLAHEMGMVGKRIKVFWVVQVSFSKKTQTA